MTKLAAYGQAIRHRIGQWLVIDRHADHRKSIFIAGTGWRRRLAVRDHQPTQRVPARLRAVPSQALTARRASSAVWTGTDPVDNWQSKVSDEQKKRAREIPVLFGLDRIFDETSMSRMEAVQGILNGRRNHEVETLPR
jgi:hypothetical protein